MDVSTSGLSSATDPATPFSNNKTIASINSFVSNLEHFEKFTTETANKIESTGTAEIDFSSIEENDKQDEDDELEQFDFKYEALLYLSDVIESCCLKKLEPVQESQLPSECCSLPFEQGNAKEMPSQMQQQQNQRQEQERQKVQRLTPLGTIKPTLSYSPRLRTQTFCDFRDGGTALDNSSSKRYMNKANHFFDLLNDNKSGALNREVSANGRSQNRSSVELALKKGNGAVSDEDSDGPILVKKRDSKPTKYGTDTSVTGKPAPLSALSISASAAIGNDDITLDQSSVGIDAPTKVENEGSQAPEHDADKSEASESVEEGFKEGELEEINHRKLTQIERGILSQTENPEHATEETAKTADAEQLKNVKNGIAETILRLKEIRSRGDVLDTVDQNTMQISIAVVGSKQSGKSQLVSRFSERACPERNTKQPVDSYCVLCTLNKTPIILRISVVHDESKVFECLDTADGVVVCISSNESFAEGLKMCQQSNTANSLPTIFVSTHVNRTDEKFPVDQLSAKDAIYFEAAPLYDKPERIQYPFVWLIKRVLGKRKLAASSGGSSAKLITKKLHKSKPSLLNDDFSFDIFDPQPSQTPSEALERFIDMDMGYQQRLCALAEVVPIAMEKQLNAMRITTTIKSAKKLLQSHSNALDCIFALSGKPIHLSEIEMNPRNPEKPTVAIEAQQPSELGASPASAIHCVLALAISAKQYIRYAMNYANEAVPMIKKFSSSQKYKQLCMILAEKDALCGCTFEQLLKLPILRLFRLVEQLSDLENTLGVSELFAAVNVVRRWLEAFLIKHADVFSIVQSKKDKDDVKKLIQALKPETSTEEGKALVTVYVNNVFQNQFHPECFELRKLVLTMNHQMQQTLGKCEVGSESTTREIIKSIVHFGEILLKRFIAKAPSKRVYRKYLVSIVTEFCISSAYPLLYSKYRERYYQDDMKVYSKIVAYQMVTPASFGIKEIFYEKGLHQNQLSATPFFAAIQYFKTMKDNKTPISKCDALIRATDAITEVSAAPIAADDLLPIFAYILVKSNCSSMFSESKFIENFLGEDEIIGREGYVVTTLQTALAFLSEFHPDDKNNIQNDESK